MRASARRTHPAESPEALQDAAVDEGGLGRVVQGLLQQRLDEVDARLDGEHHARLQDPRRAQAAQPRLLQALHALRTHTHTDTQPDHKLHGTGALLGCLLHSTHKI